MTMHYTERAQAIVRLGKELQNRGWTLFGYDHGESDAMTDYYRAAHWDGIATHPHHAGVVIGVDVSAGMVERASGKDGWPVFHSTPKGRIWHVEHDGQIVDSGVGLEPCVRVGWQQAVEKLANRIEDATHHRNVQTADKRASNIPVTVKHERTWTWLYFPEKPDETIREALKTTFGARWGKHRRAWYITRHVEADEVHQVIASAEANPEISDSPSTLSQTTNEENMSNRFKPLPKAMVQPAPYRAETNKATAGGIAGYIAGKGSTHDYIPTWMAIPPLYEAENKENPLALIKLFTPDSSWTWYVLEYDGDDTLFTLCVGQETELGYTSLSELRAVRGSLKLPIERDLWFAPTPVTDLKEYIDEWGTDGPYRGQTQAQAAQSEQNSPIALPDTAQLPEGWMLEDILFLLQKLDEGQLVLVADEKLGIPTIHTDFSVEIEHFGYGLMGAKGPGYKLTFDAGGAMEKTPGGKSRSALRLEGNPPYTYDREGVIARLQAYLPSENKNQEPYTENSAIESSFVPAWQIPLAEFLAVRGDDDTVRSEHKASVQGALLDHLPVPDGILSEYPDLAWWQNTFQQTVPHQVQRDTWAMDYLKAYFILNENSTRLDETVLAEGYQKHHGLVQQAIMHGETVLAEVLVDYPDLQPKQEESLLAVSIDEYASAGFKKMATGKQAEGLLREAAAIVPEMSGWLPVGDEVMDEEMDEEIAVPPNQSSTAAALPISGPAQASASSQPDGESEFARWELELTTGQVGKKQSIFHRTLLQITCPAVLEIALQRIHSDPPRRSAIEKRLDDLLKAKQPIPVTQPNGD